ncbi:MAG: DUF4347 domain-containing protein, partial [Cyanothece sp. SIO2G6]|nr:DUF4347 domain-containing protein [Cyanothece sp. SIO2G6]
MGYQNSTFIIPQTTRYASNQNASNQNASNHYVSACTEVHCPGIFDIFFQQSLRPPSLPNTLVVIDANVLHIEQLIKGVNPGNKVIVLDPNQDGISQITTCLAHEPTISQLHIISHGAPGLIQLGNNILSLSTISDYSQYLKRWFSNCPTSPAIALYGCNVAAGDAGAEFIETLHCLTGANISASTTITGHISVGGNWELDATIGDHTPQIAFNQKLITHYPAHFPITFSEDFEASLNLPSGWETTLDGPNAFNPVIEVFLVVDSNEVIIFASNSSDEDVDADLFSPTIQIPDTYSVLSFTHSYEWEPGFDGVALFASTDDVNFTEITELGGVFLSGAYDDTVDTGGILDGLEAWTGGDFSEETVVIVLPDNLLGEGVQFDWYVETDGFGAINPDFDAGSYFLDNVSVLTAPTVTSITRGLTQPTE